MINFKINFFRINGVILTLLLSALFLMTWAPAVSAGDDCNEQPILDLAGLGIAGTGSVCTTGVGLKAQLRAEGLMAGEAYTVWWIYIDDPSQCVPFPDAPAGTECDFSFFLNFGDPLAVMGRFDSGIAPKNGKIHFRDDLRDLYPSANSMVWLFIMAHGEAAEGGRALARQLLTPEDAFFGAPHLGIVGGELATPAASSFHVIE